MRLIDADELKKSYKQRYKESLIDRDRGIDLSEYAEMACDKFDEFVDSIPDAGKTGHWIEKDGFDGDVYYDCSECGESWSTIEGTPWDNEWNYCPSCGCRMVEPQESEDKE